MIEKTVCFTGHRNIPLLKRKAVAQRLKTELTDLINNGYQFFGAGGALGFDTLAAQTVLELKKDYKHIRLILVLPCENQTRGWKEKDIETYSGGSLLPRSGHAGLQRGRQDFRSAVEPRHPGRR